MTSGSLWNYYYYTDESNHVEGNASDDESFKYKTKIVQKHHKHQHNQIQIHKKTAAITTSTSFKC